jgi:hypothetical protein
MCYALWTYRDNTPCSPTSSSQYKKYWEKPVEREARYYEDHPQEFDLLVQYHGYSALQWETLPEVQPPTPTPPKPSILPWVIAASLAVTTTVVGVLSYTMGEKMGSLKADNEFYRKENYELLQKLEKHDPCTIIASAEEDESCNTP